MRTPAAHHRGGGGGRRDLLTVLVGCHTMHAAGQSSASQPVFHLVPPLCLLALNAIRTATVAPVLESLAIHVACRSCTCLGRENQTCPGERELGLSRSIDTFPQLARRAGQECFCSVRRSPVRGCAPAWFRLSGHLAAVCSTPPLPAAACAVLFWICQRLHL